MSKESAATREYRECLERIVKGIPLDDGTDLRSWIEWAQADAEAALWFGRQPQLGNRQAEWWTPERRKAASDRAVAQHAEARAAAAALGGGSWQYPAARAEPGGVDVRFADQAFIEASGIGDRLRTAIAEGDALAAARDQPRSPSDSPVPARSGPEPEQGFSAGLSRLTQPVGQRGRRKKETNRG